MRLRKLHLIKSLIYPNISSNSSLEYDKVKGLLLFLLLYTIICTIGIFHSPPGITEVLTIGSPIFFISYLIAKLRNFKIGGLMSIFGTLLVCYLVVFKYDVTGKNSMTALVWITVTIFIASLFLKLKQVIIYTILQITFASLLFIFSTNITKDIFISWFIINIFFIITNLFTRFILDKRQQELENNNAILEKKVFNRNKILKKALDEKDVLLKELYHRTKNNMQIISSLTNIQIMNSENTEVKSVLKKSISRLDAMSIVHKKLYAANDLRFISLKDYIYDLTKEIYSSYVLNSDRVLVTLDVVDIKIPFEISIPIGLIMNEIILNAIEHSDYGQEIIHIRIECSYQNDEKIYISIIDNGKGGEDTISLDKSKTLGLPLVKNIVKYQLRGDVIFFSKSNGFEVSIKIPFTNETIDEVKVKTYT
ncbi:MAG: histidine kinase dimerization/phosphoacceptor domain -containing protein [Spirochaetales bacterium]|uniref:histidine kinase n=1 Tax=Candidatus Thalassospirochaeta sargassi TaxID=3119039 RepID=A0AAJ1IFH6_9SPIO|nr:histidine kinase dimerization/phosphoacceptor domain -containing protein [Spirochaetales bacterium]